MNVLQNVIDLAATYQSVMPFDCCIVICDKEGIILEIVPAKKFDIGVSVGAKVAKGGSLEKSLHTGQLSQALLKRDLFGVTAKSLSLPINENGEIVGALCTITTLETQQLLSESAGTIAATAEEITATTEELAASAVELFQDLESLKTAGQNVIREIQKTDEILKFVSSVAVNSNLLGLNAAIEAARAGEQGRGFAVVAEEIRKMADDSANAVKKIKELLLCIQKEADGIVKTISNTAALGQHQGAAAEEISASMQQLASTASNLERAAEIV
ncbi:methyl-accepting chemotaxis protein [Sporomusa malonica]|uniref:Methyl-accepting chemotaxis protein (MCP) signalling domain-containing protein n=1 Tax=Sporomusa malonica TaxID=112901 RepID=A0A1W2F682_9FIRM|nr:methyl-accepting chemotaxis protein [Sporomusa malonica]SMD17332.1 Methyl-accepting chemotaxis protein (MCP) signalling domain-containing protein [Sporomusa malonica]